MSGARYIDPEARPLYPFERDRLYRDAISALERIAAALEKVAEPEAPNDNAGHSVKA